MFWILEKWRSEDIDRRKITVARTEGGGLYKCCLIADNNKYRIVNTAIKGQLTNNGILSWKLKKLEQNINIIAPFSFKALDGM